MLQSVQGLNQEIYQRIEDVDQAVDVMNEQCKEALEALAKKTALLQDQLISARARTAELKNVHSHSLGLLQGSIDSLTKIEASQANEIQTLNQQISVFNAELDAWKRKYPQPAPTPAPQQPSPDSWYGYQMDRRGGGSRD